MHAAIRNLGMALLLFVPAACAGSAQPDSGPRTVELAKGLYAITGLAESGTPAFLVTEDGVIVIDAGDSPASGRTIVEKVRETTGKPIRYLIITHYHGDHTYGIQSFPQGTVVIGSRELAENIRRFNAEEAKGYRTRLAEYRRRLDELAGRTTPEAQKERARLEERARILEGVRDLEIRYPDITFTERLHVRLGDTTVEVVRPGRTHTDCSSLVRIPDLKAVVMGDILFTRSHPYIDHRAGCSTPNWIDVLRDVLSWDVDVVLPGHGPVLGKKGIEEQIRYLEDLRREVAAAIRKGLTLEEAKKAVTMEAYRAYDWPEGLLYDIEAVYLELSSGRAPGAPGGDGSRP